MICNYCGCEESHIVAEYTRFEKNNVLQCKNCGLVYLEIKEVKEAIESFYASEYRKIPTLPVISAEEHFNDKLTQNDANNRVRFISNSLDIRDKRILEIGSASGSLLQKLSEYGCKEAVGIELDESYSEYARQLGFKVFSKSIEKLDLNEEFDGVVSFHTLEHVYNPMRVLQAVYAALRPGGCFLGEVPNQNDWRIQLFNDEVVKRFHYDPNHYYYYSPTILERYLKTCDFSNISLDTVERYNSLLQLRNILSRQNSEVNVEETLNKHIFPEDEKDEVRLPNVDDQLDSKFNSLFEKGVNMELMGNCLRWSASRARINQVLPELPEGVKVND